MLPSKPLASFALRADDLQRALSGQIVEAAGEGGDAEGRVARNHRDRDRLRRFKKLQFDVEAFLLEVALLDGKEEPAGGDEAQHGHGDFLLRQRRRGAERRDKARQPRAWCSLKTSASVSTLYELRFVEFEPAQNEKLARY